ncbi:hypothetical protein Dimus_020486, partial [Dionaea muscipula]
HEEDYSHATESPFACSCTGLEGAKSIFALSLQFLRSAKNPQIKKFSVKKYVGPGLLPN